MAATEESPWVAEVVLSDGESALVRPMTPHDAAALREFHSRQSSESIYRRFFSPKPEMTPGMATYFTSIAPDDRAALAVMSGDELIGWASYERWPGRDDAEVAFMVDDGHQGNGIATLLLEHLAAIARSNGIRRFTAETLGENRAMLSVFGKAGWPLHRRFESGVFDLDFDLTDDAGFVDSVERREQRSDSRAMARLLLPRSIAVIGASATPGTVGAELWAHVDTSFTGPRYAVNPAHERIGQVASYRSVVDVPDDVSLAIVAVPTEVLEQVIAECVAKGVRGAIIVTDPQGSDVDVGAMVSSARRSGMRIIGPTSFGVASPTTGLQAALVDVALPQGNVAISMQSGSLGGSLLRKAADMELGLSWFVSLGDKADVSGNDLLQFWADDESTAVVGLYTEAFGNPRKFARIARRVALTRPIIAVRTGAAAVGGAVDAIYRRAGVIEVPTVAALLDTVRVFSTQPIPSGPRVALLTNSRSPGLLAGAAITATGLEQVLDVPPLSFRSDAVEFADALASTLGRNDVDAVMVIHAPAFERDLGIIADQVDRAARTAAKPVVAVVIGSRDGPLCPGSPVPSFSFPEPAAAVLGRMWAYSRWRSAEMDAPATDLTDLRPDDAATVIERALQQPAGRLSFADARAVIEAYGVRVAAGGEADTVDDAVTAARAVGYPVAMKAHRRRIGRSAQAGIALDLADDDDVVAAFDTIQASLGDDALPVTVQQMVPPGVDARVRMRVDDRVGAVLEVGLGGVQADVIDPGAQRLPPLSPASARALVADSRVGAALAEAGLTDDPFVDTIVRISQLAFRHDALHEIECNPVIVSREGCWAVDIHATVSAPTAPPPLRRLN